MLDQMSFDRFKAYQGCEVMQLSSRPDQFAKGFKLEITTGFVVDGRMALAFSYTEVIPKVLR